MLNEHLKKQEKVLVSEMDENLNKNDLYISCELKKQKWN
jgi:hypothetical protein